MGGKMKRIFAFLLCLILTPILFAGEHADIDVTRWEYDATIDKIKITNNDAR